MHLRKETEARLQEIVQETGRPANDLVEDAMASYLQELAQTREMLDGRYDEITNGRVTPVDGEAAFTTLRRKSEARRP